MRHAKSVVLLNAVTPVAITSSTDATPIVITATAHGLVTGNQVLIYGHTTNVAANGMWNVTKLTANTFSIVNPYTGASVAGSGAGAGSSGICMLAPKIAHSTDYRHAILEVSTSGSATTTLKVAGTISPPSNSTYTVFGATVSASNPYTFMQLVNLDDGSTLNGSTGVVVTGTDVNAQYQVSVNAMQYMTIIPVTWSAGAITAKLFLADNE